MSLILNEIVSYLVNSVINMVVIFNDREQERSTSLHLGKEKGFIFIVGYGIVEVVVVFLATLGTGKLSSSSFRIVFLFSNTRDFAHNIGVIDEINSAVVNVGEI